MAARAADLGLAAGDPDLPAGADALPDEAGGLSPAMTIGQVKHSASDTLTNSDENRKLRMSLSPFRSELIIEQP
ncbi:MAG TPA: hypothetical protein VME17_15745 [Bryobacteraceae bacterium]|nr:hypothetical protein [Bryobacteraceae bacterium]